MKNKSTHSGYRAAIAIIDPLVELDTEATTILGTSSDFNSSFASWIKEAITHLNGEYFCFLGLWNTTSPVFETISSLNLPTFVDPDELDKKLKAYQLSNIFYSGFHLGRCINKAPCGQLNMKQRGYDCDVILNLSQVYPGDNWDSRIYQSKNYKLWSPKGGLQSVVIQSKK